MAPPMGAGDWTEGFRRKAREKAQKEYDAQWNLRPVEPPPEGLVEALRAAADAMGQVRWITLGEYRDDSGEPAHVVVGVRVAPGGLVTFGAVKERLMGVLRSALGPGSSPEVVELEAEVDDTMADESPNPYVVYKRVG